VARHCDAPKLMAAAGLGNQRSGDPDAGGRPRVGRRLSAVASAIHMNIFRAAPGPSSSVTPPSQKAAAFCAAADRPARRRPCLRGDRARWPGSTRPGSRRRAGGAPGADHYGPLSGAQDSGISTAQVAEKMLILARTTPIRGGCTPSLGDDACSIPISDRSHGGGCVRSPRLGRKAGRLEPALHRRAEGAGRRPHRRRRARASIISCTGR